MRGGLLADPDELLDRAEGLGKHRRGCLADMPDTQRQDEAVELGLAPAVDVREELVEALIGALLGRQHLLALGAARLLPRPRLLLAAIMQRLLHGLAMLLEPEDVDRVLEQAPVEEQLDLLGA